VSVVSLQFDNEFARNERSEMQRTDQWERYTTIAKYVAILLIALVFILFLRSLARTVAEAMNPPAPKLEPLGVVEEIEEEVPENVRRTSVILERVEMLTREAPVNIAQIVRQWLGEIPTGQGGKKH
jgi:flagellar biosynthesis/type III secretory pathway M-ring protein FliF/YscJ